MRRDVVGCLQAAVEVLDAKRQRESDPAGDERRQEKIGAVPRQHGTDRHFGGIDDLQNPHRGIRGTLRDEGGGVRIGRTRREVGICRSIVQVDEVRPRHRSDADAAEEAVDAERSPRRFSGRRRRWTRRTEEHRDSPNEPVTGASAFVVGGDPLGERRRMMEIERFHRAHRQRPAAQQMRLCLVERRVGARAELDGRPIRRPRAR